MVHHPSASSPLSQPTAPVRPTKGFDILSHRGPRVHDGFPPRFGEGEEEEIDSNSLGLYGLPRHPYAVHPTSFGPSEVEVTLQAALSRTQQQQQRQQGQEPRRIYPRIKTPHQERQRGRIQSAKFAVWRAWIWFAGSFGIAVMEPWERVLSIIVYLSLVMLLILFLTRLPSTLSSALSRLTFYATGTELGAMSSSAVGGVLRLAAGAVTKAGATTQGFRNATVAELSSSL